MIMSPPLGRNGEPSETLAIGFSLRLKELHQALSRREAPVASVDAPVKSLGTPRSVRSRN